MINDDAKSCMRPNYNSTVLLRFCVPELETTLQTLNTLAVKIGSKDYLGSLIKDVQTGWPIIIIMSAITLAITILYIFLLQWLAKPMLYVCLFLFVGGILGAGAYLMYLFTTVAEGVQSPDGKGYLGGAISLWIVAFFVICFIICQWKNIRLGAAVLQASSDFMSSNQRLIFLPLINYFIMAPIVAAWLVFMAFLGSIGTPKYKESSYISTMQYDQAIIYLFLFMLFGILWVLAFMEAIEKFIIASTTCMWYFSGEGSDGADKTGKVSIWLSTKWAFVYHIGTMAMGSLLIAILSLIKLIFEYIVKKSEASGQANNQIIKIVICATRCCIWCVESYIRFVNSNAYIQCALFSTNFCKSAQQGFYLTVRNGGRFTGLDISIFLVSLLGRGILIALNVYICVLISNAYEVELPIVFAVITAIIALVITTLFLTIFDFSSLAILQCFLLDEDLGGSKKTPDSLKPFLEMTFDNGSKETN